MSSRCLLVGLALLLAACRSPVPEQVSLVLVPPAALEGEVDAELAIEGLSALLLARLRALPEVDVRIDAAGCQRAPQPSHALKVTRMLTDVSAITSASLQRCDSGRTTIEQWVQPRHARRDWSSLAAWWVGGELKVPRPRPITGPAVDEAEMQGLWIALARLKRRTSEDVRTARDSLQQIVRQRPDFALAQAHLATAHLLAFEYGLLPLADALQQADASIRAALATAPDMGMAHAARGLYWMNQDRYDLAVPQLARAAALDPGESSILLWMGNALLYHGRPRDAEPWLVRAQMLDPELVSAQISLGELACLSGQQARCAQLMEDPTAGPMAGFMAALMSAQRGDLERAHALLDEVSADVNPGWVQALRIDVCGLGESATEECSHVALAEVGDGAADRTTPVPRWAERVSADELSSAGPAANLDLWRVDLGLAGWVQGARQDAGRRQQLDAEIQRLRRGGLALPLVADIEYCLQQWQQPQLPPRTTPLAIMLRAWGCAAELPIVVN